MFTRPVVIALVAALLAGLGLMAGKMVFDRSASSPWPATRVVEMHAPRAIPAFNLAQSDGTRLVPGELRGHWTLVYLGFTACPDVCPTTLAELAQAQKRWQALPDSTRPRILFVSVDPERDSPAKAGEYARAFHRDSLAASGDLPALENFAGALHLVFGKAPGKHFDENPNDYAVDHSASIAVLDPEGRLAGLIRPPFDPAAIADDMTLLTKAPIP